MCVVVWECVVEQWLGVRCCVGMCCGAVARCALYDAFVMPSFKLT